MKSPIRTVIIGYGRSGRYLHASGLRGNANAFQIVAISSKSEASLRQASEDFHCPTFSNYQEMLREIRPELVIIVTRNDQHHAMACDALTAGCHILVTKPLGINQHEVADIYRAADAVGRKVFPFLPARWGTDFRRIQEIIHSGEIGKVFSIRRAVYGFATRSDWQTRTECGGGIILNWGAHLVEPPILLAGGEPRHLFGSCARVLNPGNAEDIFHCVITMENGIRIHSEWSFAPRGLANWFVQGTGGCIIGNSTTLDVITGQPSHPDDPTKVKDMEGSPSTCRTETVGEDLFGDPVAIYQDVAADLSGETPYSVSRRESIRLLALLDGIKTSHQYQKLITFP
ncbi:Gfo/Idh/MocA family protein [Luteolibacter algae]|uniref:Gfo/Idh/MocA family protein n=1 Tax=Luteolibacter algae TaxID=454151 RepID=A0ABW5D806_9BACT